MRLRFWAVLLLGFLFLPMSSFAAGKEIAVIDRNGQQVRFHVEMAITPEQRAQGLMWRQEMPGDAGMLFIFPRISWQTMWMKDTPLSLDMLFIGHDGRILRIVEGTIPFSTRVIASRRPIKAVLELNAGSVSRHGIRTGDRLIQPKLQISSN